MQILASTQSPIALSFVLVMAWPQETQAINSWRPSDAYASLVQIDNGLSPGQCQAIIANNAGILLIGSLGINSIEILFETHKLHSRESIPKCRLMMTHPVNWRDGGYNPVLSTTQLSIFSDTIFAC